MKIAVHVHVFYASMWPLLKTYLLNMGDTPYDLFVTLTQENKELEADIHAFHAGTKVQVLENRGYDVGPFIWFLNKINLADYDYILKLHTKNNKGDQTCFFKGLLVNRVWWARLLIEALIGSRAVFKRNLNAFQEDKTLGMIGSHYLIVSGQESHKFIKKGLENELKRLNAEMPLSQIRFVAGTMFMVRSSLMADIRQNYTLTDFEITNSAVKDGSLAHVLERLFGCVVLLHGYKIKGFDRNVRFFIWGFLRYIRWFFYQKKRTKKGFIIVKICRIPVCHKKIVS